MWFNHPKKHEHFKHRNNNTSLALQNSSLRFSCFFFSSPRKISCEIYSRRRPFPVRSSPSSWQLWSIFQSGFSDETHFSTEETHRCARGIWWQKCVFLFFFASFRVDFDFSFVFRWIYFVRVEANLPVRVELSFSISSYSIAMSAKKCSKTGKCRFSSGSPSLRMFTVKILVVTGILGKGVDQP